MKDPYRFLGRENVVSLSLKSAALPTMAMFWWLIWQGDHDRTGTRQASAQALESIEILSIQVGACHQL